MSFPQNWNVTGRDQRPIVVATLLCVLIPSGCRTTPTAGQMEAAAASRSAFVGQPAPEFALPNQHGETVHGSDLRGQWVVLYFYPKDDTPGCTCQATEFTALLWSFRDMNAVVLGVSSDSPQEHTKFIEKYDLKLDLLSDPDRDTMRQYGAWASVQHGSKKTERVIRSTVIISPDGVIAEHYPEVIPRGHAQRVRDRLRDLRAAAN